MPNHTAASKSSVYISNYTAAHGVLELSGRSPFHLCAASSRPTTPYYSLTPSFFLSLTHTCTQVSYFSLPPSPLSSSSLFIYFHQPYLCCSFRRLHAKRRRSFCNADPGSFELAAAGPDRSQTIGGGAGGRWRAGGAGGGRDHL